MKVLVTGADGFVGRWLVRRLLADGREVYGAVRPGQSPPPVPPAADHAVDLVSLVEQQLGEVRAVLAGDPGDECGLGHGGGELSS